MTLKYGVQVIDMLSVFIHPQQKQLFKFQEIDNEGGDDDDDDGTR